VFNGARVAVIVPAFNEERLIARAVRGVPSFVDAIYVVDDASRDRTVDAAEEVGDPRVAVVRHPYNQGVGAAIRTGYLAARAAGAQVLAVMAGDAQMDPADLAAIVAPVVEKRADYVKGDRFAHPSRRDMPWMRRAGGRVLSVLTARAAGLERLSDSQCGYTALSAAVLDELDLDGLWPRYGYPNDLIGHLAMAGLRIAEVPVRPVYGDETSGLKPRHFLVILGLIARVAWRRARLRPRGPRSYPHSGAHDRDRTARQSVHAAKAR
jgi:glycosyltransferase involved in cell wall biosynthesis